MSFLEISGFLARLGVFSSVKNCGIYPIGPTVFRKSEIIKIRSLPRFSEIVTGGPDVRRVRTDS